MLLVILFLFLLSLFSPLIITPNFFGFVCLSCFVIVLKPHANKVYSSLRFFILEISDFSLGIMKVLHHVTFPFLIYVQVLLSSGLLNLWPSAFFHSQSTGIMYMFHYLQMFMFGISIIQDDSLLVLIFQLFPLFYLLIY